MDIDIKFIDNLLLEGNSLYAKHKDSYYPMQIILENIKRRFYTEIRIVRDSVVQRFPAEYISELYGIEPEEINEIISNYKMILVTSFHNLVSDLPKREYDLVYNNDAYLMCNMAGVPVVNIDESISISELGLNSRIEHYLYQSNIESIADLCILTKNDDWYKDIPGIGKQTACIVKNALNIYCDELKGGRDLLWASTHS